MANTNNSCNTEITVSLSQEVTMPKQSAFSAYKAVAGTNLTGAGADSTFVLDTTYYNINSNFNTGTSMYVAPVNSLVLLSCRYVTTDYTAAMTSSNFQAAGQNRQSNSLARRIGPMRDVNNAETMCIEALYDMDAGDTASAYFRVTGGASNAIDGIAYYQGELIC